MRKTQDSNVRMRAGNTGLTVKVNLWSLAKVKDQFNAESARLWIKGQVTHADTGKVEKFNDGGRLLSILGKWNASQLRDLKKQS